MENETGLAVHLLSTDPSEDSAPQGWQPIDGDTPRDGSTILLARFAWLTDVSDLGDDPKAPEYRERLFNDNAPKVYHLCWTCGGFWSSKYNNWNDGIEPCGLARPTHWTCSSYFSALEAAQ